MAQINWIKGTLRGKLGEVIGETWKGKPYVKTYTKPRNPNTPKQIAIRATFQKIAFICKQIRTPLETYTRPKPKGMTAYNHVIQLNKTMFEKTGEKWNPLEFVFMDGDLTSANIATATFSTTSFEAIITWQTTIGEATDKAFVIIFNNKDNKAVYATEVDRSTGTVTIDASIFAGTSDYADIYAYLAFYRINEDETGVNSATAILKVTKS
jgi:hypothetical protein